MSAEKALGFFEEALRAGIHSGVAERGKFLQLRFLRAVQLGGNAGHITSLFASAAVNGVRLNSFERVEQVYTDDIFGGRIGRYFDQVFDECVPDAALQAKALWLLTENIAARDGRVPTAYWKRHSELSSNNLEQTLGALHDREIVNVSSGSVESGCIMAGPTGALERFTSRSKIKPQRIRGQRRDSGGCQPARSGSGAVVGRGEPSV